MKSRHEQLVRAGRAGGTATAAKYGTEHYRAIGAKGGRPTFREALRRAQEREAQARRKSRKPAQVSTNLGLRLEQASALKLAQLADASGYSRAQVVRLLIEQATLESIG